MVVVEAEGLDNLSPEVYPTLTGPYGYPLSDVMTCPKPDRPLRRMHCTSNP